MKAVLQRVRSAGVIVEDRSVGEIGPGLLILVGVTVGDNEQTSSHLAEKCAKLRIFEDSDGKMNRSVLETNGEVLVVSQFTLYADTAKGLRPSFTAAAPPQRAEELYHHFTSRLRALGLTVKTGIFGTRMVVRLENAGPVTLILEV